MSETVDVFRCPDCGAGGAMVADQCVCCGYSDEHGSQIAPGLYGKVTSREEADDDLAGVCSSCGEVSEALVNDECQRCSLEPMFDYYVALTKEML